MNIPEIIIPEIARALGLDSARITLTLRPPLDFQSNRLYDVYAGGRHLIAKEYLQPDEFEVAPLREYKALRLLAPLDIAPQPVFYDPTAGPLVLYEYMEGQMWDRRPATAGDLSKLMRLWGQMNEVPADWFSRNHERPLAEIMAEFGSQLEAYHRWVRGEFTPGLPAAEACLAHLERHQAVAQELAGHTPPLCFCRADPRFANVIQRPGGGLGLVDWEDSGLRDAARDVADLLTHPNQEDLLCWEEWQAFMQPYLAMQGRRDKEIGRRVHLYLALLPFFWITIFVQRGIRLAAAGRSCGWTINGLPANERLRRYLARAAAWPSMEFGRKLENFSALEFFPERQGKSS